MFDEESHNITAMLVITAIAIYKFGIWKGLAIGGCVMITCLGYAISQVGGGTPRASRDMLEEYQKKM